MEIKNHPNGLTMAIDDILSEKIAAMAKVAQSEEFFVWVQQALMKGITENGLIDEPVNAPKSQAYVYELVSKCINEMVQNVIEGRNLVKKEENV